MDVGGLRDVVSGHPALDVDVAHPLAGDGRLLQYHVRRVPDDHTQLEPVNRHQSLFIPGIFLGEGGKSPHKKTYNPPNGCHIVCSKSFFSAGIVNYKYITESLLMDNRHRKLFVSKQSKG